MALKPARMNPDSAAQMSFDVPVLLITWRRPDTTRQVIDAMRCVAPSKIYVASDGPRTEKEAHKVLATRDLIKAAIDWPCEIKTRYSEINQGCECGVSSAITWFFDHEHEGIILEDDCVPHIDFFSYCRDLLNRYRLDRRVFCISGNNFQGGHWRGESTYYFSRYVHIWGWACWRDRWSEYKKNAEIWSVLSTSHSYQETIFPDQYELSYWMAIWSKLFGIGVPDTWDYRWTLVCMASNSLSATPNKNLVANIGFGEDATHTVDSLSEPIKSYGLDDQVIVHPELIIRDSEADKYTSFYHYGIKPPTFKEKAKSFVKKIVTNLLPPNVA